MKIILKKEVFKKEKLHFKNESLIHKSKKNVDKKVAKNFRVRKNYF